MDLYHIPNDDGKTYRLEKFVEYQHEVPPVDTNFLVEYANRHNLNNDEIVELAFWHATTYCEITSALLLELNKESAPADIWKRYGNTLKFNSARKHMKLNGRFELVSMAWNDCVGTSPYNKIKALESDNPYVTYKRIFDWYSKIWENGRFSSDLFLELIVKMKDKLNIRVAEPPNKDWNKCLNLTSGLFNIFYEDEKAVNYEKTKRVTLDEKAYLTAKLQQVQRAVEKTYPDENPDITYFIGKICSFRNLFKGARYGGYHHDRQLEEIRHYQDALPEWENLWKECYDIRKTIFQPRFLGEINGWNGIRKDRKKLWLKTGKTGAEK